ncbi:hypothetical protein TGRUB_282040 [Toxoplasma gondii RUB]|uniref:Uncharacterized protein n=1 Tax=Toxoplasma gondii RUB TaxID=935652 RepID=A0A086LLC2_TOXGO|nr:hypothetical protein TGRUB_282040 [Toxoplasma gondii RUB]
MARPVVVSFPSGCLGPQSGTRSFPNRSCASSAVGGLLPDTHKCCSLCEFLLGESVRSRLQDSSSPPFQSSHVSVPSSAASHLSNRIKIFVKRRSSASPDAVTAGHIARTSPRECTDFSTSSVPSRPLLPGGHTLWRPTVNHLQTCGAFPASTPFSLSSCSKRPFEAPSGVFWPQRLTEHPAATHFALQKLAFSAVGGLQIRTKCDVAALPPWKRWLPKRRARLGHLSATEGGDGVHGSAGSAAPAADIRGVLLLANASLVQRIQSLQRSGQLHLRRLPAEVQKQLQARSQPAGSSVDGETAGSRAHGAASGARPRQRLNHESGDVLGGRKPPNIKTKTTERRHSQQHTERHVSPGDAVSHSQAPSDVAPAASTPSPSPFFVVLRLDSRTGATGETTPSPTLLPNFRALLQAARVPASPSSPSVSPVSLASAGAALVAGHLTEYLTEVVPFLPDLAATSRSSVRDEDEGVFAAAVLRALLIQASAFLAHPPTSFQALSVLMAFSALSPSLPFECQQMPHQLEEERRQKQLRKLQPLLAHPAAKRLFEQLLRICSGDAPHSTDGRELGPPDGEASAATGVEERDGNKEENTKHFTLLQPNTGAHRPVHTLSAPSGAAMFSVAPEVLRLPPIDESAVLPLLEAYWRLGLQQPDILALLLNCVALEHFWIDERQLVRLCSFLAFYERPSLDAAVALAPVHQQYGRTPGVPCASEARAKQAERDVSSAATLQGANAVCSSVDESLVRGHLAAAVFRVFDLAGARLAERFEFFTDDDVGDICRALVRMKRNHDRLREQHARQALDEGRALRLHGNAEDRGQIEHDRATRRDRRDEEFKHRKKNCSLAHLEDRQRLPHLEPFTAYFNVWQRPLGVALQRHLPLTLHDFRYWNLIDVGEMIAEFQTDRKDFFGSGGLCCPRSNAALTVSSRWGDLPDLAGKFGYVPTAYAEGVLEPRGDTEGEDLAQRIASEVWKFSIMMRFGYTGKALMVLHKLDVGDPRTQRSLLRHVTKLFGFSWAGNFFAELTVAAATAAYKARIPVERQKKGVHVAGWRLYNNFALYLLRPIGVADTPFDGSHASSAAAPGSEEPSGTLTEAQEEAGEDGEADKFSVEDEAEAQDSAGSSVVTTSPSASRPVVVSRKKQRLRRLIDTVSSPLLCCEIATAFARLGVPQAALLHAIVDRAEAEGRGWMHLQHLISLARDMQEVSVHSERLLAMLLDAERQKAELPNCSPAALALLPLLLGRIRGCRPVHMPTLLRLHQLLLDETNPLATMREFFSDKDVEWHKTLQTAAKYIAANGREDRLNEKRLEEAGAEESETAQEASPSPPTDTGSAVEAGDSLSSSTRYSFLTARSPPSIVSTSFVSAVSPFPVCFSGDSKTVFVQGEKEGTAAATADAAREARWRNSVEALMADPALTCSVRGEAADDKASGDAGNYEGTLLPTTQPEICKSTDMSLDARTARTDIRESAEQQDRWNRLCTDDSIESSAPLFKTTPRHESSSGSQKDQADSATSASRQPKDSGGTQDSRLPDEKGNRSQTPSVRRLALFSVDDLVVLLRGLELSRCCSKPLTNQVLRILERRKSEVTAGHLPGLLSGLATVSGGGAYPLMATGCPESVWLDAETGQRSKYDTGRNHKAASATNILEELIDTHIGALSDEEVPACIWAAYALGIPAVRPSLRSELDEHRLSIGSANEHLADAECRAQPGALVKLIRRFLGASLNVSAPLMHLLQVVGVCFRLDALRNPHLQQPEELGRFADLVEGSPIILPGGNVGGASSPASFSVRSLVARSALASDAHREGDGLRTGEQAHATGLAGATGGWREQGNRTRDSDEAIATSPSEATRLRDLATRKAVAAALENKGLVCAHDLPAFPFTVDLAFNRPVVRSQASIAGDDQSFEKGERDTSGGASGLTLATVDCQVHTQPRGTRADEEKDRTIASLARSPDRDEEGREVEALPPFIESCSRSTLAPPKPVWSHTWQVPDEGFRAPHAAAGEDEHVYIWSAIQGSSKIRSPSSQESTLGTETGNVSPVAIFVVGSYRSLCLSDLSLLQTRQAERKVRPAHDGSHTMPCKGEDAFALQWELDLTNQMTKRDAPLPETGEGLGSREQTPMETEGNAMRTDLNKHGVTIVSKSALEHSSGWRLGPYEQLRDRVLKDLGWQVFYVFAR